jgi:hypothetical protein
MSESKPSAHVLDLKAFKDTTNILQGLFKGKGNQVMDEKESNFDLDQK